MKKFPAIDLESIKNKIHKYINRNLGTILIYHSVVDVPFDFYPWTHMPASLFEEHMAMIVKEANVLSLQEMVSRIENGKLPDYSVAITFDDGFRNNYTRAYPILKKHEIPATIFLTTGYIGGKKLLWPDRVAYQLMRTKVDFIDSDLFGKLNLSNTEDHRKSYRLIVNKLKEFHPYRITQLVARLEEQLGAACDENDPLYLEMLPLTWNEARTMEKEGLVSFGGHTVNHAILNRLADDSEAYQEIAGCRHTMDTELSIKSTQWAYPNGALSDFSCCHEEMLKENGFKEIFSSSPEYVHSGSNIGRLPRIGIGGHIGLDELETILNKRYYLGQFHGLSKLSAFMSGLKGYSK